MRKIKEILHLRWELGLAARQIAHSLSISHSTVLDMLRRAERAGITWSLPDLDDAALECQLYPGNPDPGLQWRLRADKAEIQVEKMRRALDAKGAQVWELQTQLDNHYTTGSGVTDSELGSALQEALKRAKTAEEQSKDLRLRLFAKKVVRMRDKVRRLGNKHAAKRGRLTE